MKKVCKNLIYIIITSVFLVSCNDLLTVDSNRLTFEKDYQMQSPNDTIYSMIGIYSQLEKLGDSYVLLGELRGDLLDVTENSSQDLRDINNLEISENNRYANIKDYYSVINNCNYVIHNIDTSTIIKGDKVMKRYYAAAKGIRAWTYMQIALNFGTVKYYSKPILSVADAELVNKYPDISFKELSDSLITDILPWKDEKTPSFVGSVLTFPIRFLLGDLYLWRGSFTDDQADYISAATEYHDLMLKGIYDMNTIGININYNLQSYWTLDDNKRISTSRYMNWYKSFNINNMEAITGLYCPTEYGQKFDLDSLNYNYQFKPSDVAINNWDSQTYFNTPTDTKPGDLRKFESIINKNSILSYTTNMISTTSNPVDKTVKNIVFKYLWNGHSDNRQAIIVYRASLLYLRYAEAVNRLNKPNLAFAVLKNGLRSTTVASPKIVPLKERTGESYMSFSDPRFNNNAGIRWRGLGPKLVGTTLAVTDCDSTFVIKEQNNLSDSVLYVEDLIQQELALETAFEGNRFQDLMRFAIRRKDASYLASKIYAKHALSGTAINKDLTQPENWYIKVRK